MSRWKLPAVILAALIPAACGVEELPPGADWLRYVQRDADLLVYVDDPLPHLDTALGSERLLRALGVEASDAAQHRLQLRAIREYVPSRACLSIPRSGMRALGAVWRALDAGGRCEQAVAAGGEGLRAAQEELAAAVAELQGARASLYVAFRDPRTAESLFERLLDLRGLWTMNPALEVEEKLDAIEVRLQASSFAEGRGFSELLARLGLVASAGDPGVETIRTAVAGLSTRITIELVGDGLACTLGAMDGGSPIGLTSLWGNEPLPAVYAQWDLAAWRSAIPQAGRAAGTELPFLPSMADLMRLMARSAEAPITGSLRVDLDEQAVVLVAEHPPAEDGFSVIPPEVFDRWAAELQLRRESSTAGSLERSELRISLRR